VTEYEGTVVHRSRDRYGELVVADGGMTRTLYFGKGTKQSSMFLDDPSLPAMHYMRAMMTALIFCRHPERALFVGLGGGGTVKFYRRACPGCFVEAVELRGEVIRLAHEFFHLPDDDPLARIVQGDGAEYVLTRRGEEVRYDHIFVDAFDEHGPAPAVTGGEFMTACRNLLSEKGQLVFDLWTHEGAGYGKHRDLLAEVFQGAVRELPLDSAEGNALVFAFRSPDDMERNAERDKIAADLEKEFGISFTRFLNALSQKQGQTPI
jgi:spermidine synthase